MIDGIIIIALGIAMVLGLFKVVYTLFRVALELIW